MPFQPPYLVAAKNLAPFLEALRHAQAPEKVTVRFIEQLGFKSTNDRLFILGKADRRMRACQIGT